MELRKEIMSRLKNTATENGKKEDICRYKQQRDKVVQMNKLARIKAYQDFHMSNLTNGKGFSKTVNPLFS